MKWFRQEKLNFTVPRITSLYARGFRREFITNITGRIILLSTLFLLIITIISPFIFSTETVYTDNIVVINSPLSNSNIIGTDIYGRDLLRMLLVSLHYSFGSALLLTLISLSLVIPLGLWLGFRSAMHKDLVGGAFDLLLSIPTILLAISLVSLFQNSLLIAMSAIFIASLPHALKSFVFAVRQQTKKSYVAKLSLDGLSDLDIVRYSLLPTIVPVIISAFRFLLIFNFVDIILLGLIGIGADHKIAEIGTLLHQGWKNTIYAHWLLIIPNFVIVLVIFIILVFTNRLEKATRIY